MGKQWQKRVSKIFIQSNSILSSCVKVTQSFPTPCDPKDYTVHGILLEWVAFPFFRGSSQPRNRTGVSCIVGRFFTS